MGVTVNGAVLGQAGRVLAAVCLCWICAGEALAQGICAEVRLRISQEAVMTRSAFKATLELANNSSTATVDNAGVDIYISTLQDCSVPDGNDLFAGDDTPTVSGFDHGSTGVLITGGTARFEWMLIPSRLAAPDNGPTQYYIGGALRYSEDGVERSTPLLPALVTVHPEAALELDYFQVRDVPGDDAMTPNVVEPSDPFPLGLIVRNTGRGDALNLSIASAQPEIVENEKGLLVDFRITGAKVGAEAAKPSLTVALGDIAPGGTKVAEWTMLCSLMGTFREYTASFTHRNDTGTTGMSLIESVRVHELAHSMLIPGDDAIPDFLANDETVTTDGLPDTIYSSQGGVPLPVSPYTAQGDIGRITFAGTVGQSPVTTMTALAMPSGWVYLRADNPAAKTAYELKSVSRDGVALPVPQNAWTSRFTRHDDTHTTRENFIHVVDHRAVQGSRVYTLVFAEPSQEPRVSVSPEGVPGTAPDLMFRES